MRSLRTSHLKFSSISDNDIKNLMGYLMELNEGEKINISKIAKQLKIHRQTLSSWLKNVSIDNNFNPKVNYSNAHLAMTPELEEQILFEIEENFLSPGYFIIINDSHVTKVEKYPAKLTHLALYKRI